MSLTKYKPSLSGPVFKNIYIWRENLHGVLKFLGLEIIKH